MKTKAEIDGETGFNKEGTSDTEPHPRVGVKGVGERQPSGAAVGEGGRTTRQKTTARRPKGVVVLSSNVVRVPPKKVELFIEKRKSWCGIAWKNTKMIGKFCFDKQPREHLLQLPVWTSRRSTLDLDRVLRHKDYSNVRITVHLRGGVQANFSTSMDWLINEMVADEFVLRLNGKYMSLPRELAPVKVTAIRPHCQEKVGVGDDGGNMGTEEERQRESLDEVKAHIENKDEDVGSDTAEAEEEKVVVKNDVVEDKEEDEERWRNVVVVGGPLKGQEDEGVGCMNRIGMKRPGTAASTVRVANTFEEKVLRNVRRVVAVIMVLCAVAVLVDAWWNEDDFQ